MITRELTCKLTEDQKAAKAQELAATLARIDELEEDKKAATKSQSDAIKGLKANAKKLRVDYQAGSEKRIVDCKEVRRFETNTVETIRMDTNEVVETRAMKADERQGTLIALEREATKARMRKVEASAEG